MQTSKEQQQLEKERTQSLDTQMENSCMFIITYLSLNEKILI